MENANYTSESMKLAESVIAAAGSSLRHYMPSSRERIITACQKGIDDAHAELVDALEGMIAVYGKPDGPATIKARAALANARRPA
jgi:hypothetical protein